MATLVLTVIGDDQSGLVDVLSGVVSDHAGNWEKSHMARLAGKFAGIVMVTVPDQNVDRAIQLVAECFLHRCAQCGRCAAGRGEKPQTQQIPLPSYR